MPMMRWINAFSVKVKQFDTQHQKLVDILNELYDGMRLGKGKEVLDGVLFELITYTNTHFAAEEKLMTEHRYPGLVPHKAEHEALKKKVTEFQTQFRSGKVSISLEVMDFLKDWLTHHIQVVDRQYGQFFNDHGVL